MLKMFRMGKYYYHLLLKRHNELLHKDCLSEEVRMKLKVKAIYHSSMAVELGSKIYFLNKKEA